MSNHIERSSESERSEAWKRALYLTVASAVLLLADGGSTVNAPPPERPPVAPEAQFTPISIPQFSYELPAPPRPGPERPPEPPKTIVN